MTENNDKSRHLQVIKASAGSGKTYSLARTYIVNLLGKKQPDGKYRLRRSKEYHKHILAITFTNKATDEMKERIVKQLHKLSVGKGDYVDFFARNFVNTMEEIQEAAAMALSEILFNYNSFAVSTIDSFFQMILRTFAHDVDYDNGYEIQLDDKVALQSAVHDFLLDLGTGRINRKSKVFRWVEDYIRSRLSDSHGWNFFGSPKGLIDFAQNLSKEFYRDKGKEIHDYFSDMGKEGLTRVEQFRKAIAERRQFHSQRYENAYPEILREIMGKYGIEPSSFYGNRLLSKLYNGNVPKKGGDIEKYTGGEDCLNNLFLKAAFQKLPIDALTEIVTMLRQMLGDWVNVGFMSALLGNIWQLGLLGVIDEKLHDNLRETNTMLLSDTGDLLHDIIFADTSADNTSFVYERIGTRYNNFMIDEFQDTSHKQYENFKPLLLESLSNGNDDLIIGDEKQAIYRFRNSDPSMLREELEQNFGNDYVGSSLADNYRSFAAIINFNNVLFSIAPHAWFGEMPTLAKTYRNVIQNVKKNERFGYVRIDFLYEDTENEKEEKNNKTKSEKKKTKTFKKSGKAIDQVLDLLPARIYSILNRGFNMSDIMILTNTRREALAVVNKLMSYNAYEREEGQGELQIISDESLLLINSPAIRMIINVLRFIESSMLEVPDDDADISDRVKRLVRQQRRYKLVHDFGQALSTSNDDAMSQSDLLRQQIEKNRKLYVEGSEQSALEELMKIASEIMPDNVTQPINLVTIVDRIIEIYLADNENGCDPKSSVFITAFQDEVLRFTMAVNGGSIREFLRYWDQNCRKLSLPATSLNAIEVMTIHKSKGLEAPVVIMPFADWVLTEFNKKEILWIPSDVWHNADPAGGYDGIDGDIVPPLIPISHSNLAIINEFKDFYNSEREKTLIDNLNKTYVAFTRPCQELHVFSTGAPDADLTEAYTVNHLLRLFAREIVKNNGEFGLKTVEGDDRRLKLDYKFSFANETQSLFKEIEIGETELKYEKTGERDDYEVPVEAVLDLPRYKVRTDIDDVNVSLPEVTTISQREGNDMHWLMSLLRDSRDVAYAINMAMGSNHFKDYNQRYWTLERAVELISKVVDDPIAGTWFDPQNTVFNERSIYGALPDDSLKGKAKDNHRPDRIVISPDGTATVIDYKFGEQYDKNVRRRYSRQVSDYMRLLQLAGYKKVDGYLWFFRDENNPIIKVEIE